MTLDDIFGLQPAPIYSQFVRRIEFGMSFDGPPRKYTDAERAELQRARWAREREKYHERRLLNMREWRKRKRAEAKAAA